MFDRCGLRGVLIIVSAVLIAAMNIVEVRAQQRVRASVAPNRDAASNSADIYDPLTGKISPAGIGDIAARSAHTATLMTDGRVLFAGGSDGRPLNTAQLYDPATGSMTWAAGLLTVRRTAHTATLLPDGKVLLAGGYSGTYLQSAEVYDPYFNSFSPTTGSMITARSNHTAMLLKTGKVLIAGGFNGDKTAELYDPDTGQFTSASGMTTGRRDHTATLLADGKVLVVGGASSGSYLKAAEIFDPTAGSFTSAAGQLSTARSGHSATLLSNGKVLIAGGFNGTYLNTAEIFDPGTRTFSAAGGSMTAARAGHAAVALPGGRVLLSGGGSPNHLDSAEIFDESSGRFTPVGSTMAEPRSTHTATVLSNGNVLLLGGLRRSLLEFDVNLDQTDNISPNILFSQDSKFGYVPFTGSGLVAVFSTETGEILQRIETGGNPAFSTPLPGGQRFAVVSALDNKVFLIDMAGRRLISTYSFTNALFGFGSIITVSADGKMGYISSTGTGEVIQFNMDDGKEVGRLKGLQTPAQITLSRDGATLMVVDTSAEDLVFANTSTLTQKSTLKAKQKEPGTNFTIFNKAVLTSGGESGIIASREANGALASDTAFVFSTATGEILDTEKIGSEPGFTGLTPDGKYWVLLNDLSLTVIPTRDPKSKYELQTPQGGVLGSANLVFSPDSRYALYVSSESDLVFQHDLGTTAVVGKTAVGDSLNEQLDQPSSLALTPDGKTIAVLNFVGNTIDLLESITLLEGAKFTSTSLTFTGLSLVNLASQPASITATAFDNYGQLMTGSGMTNPAAFDLAPNSQVSLTVQSLFNLNPTAEYTGRLEVTSNQPEVVGYLSMGEVRLTYLGFFIPRLSGAPLIREQLYDFIVPEIVRGDGTAVELDYVNRNYNQGSYDVKRFAADGGLLETTAGSIAYPTNRLAQYFNEIFQLPGEGSVLLIGGEASGSAVTTVESYYPTSQTFQAAASMASARTDHTATVLPNAKVLVAGGRNASGSLTSAEVYNRSSPSFAATTGTMTVSRERHTATLLSHGSVLLTGGLSSGTAQSSAEIYNPASGVFTATTGVMSVARHGHTATWLPDGRVLIAGGNTGSSATSVAEIYDPISDTFSLTGSLSAARAFHTATLLPGGKVLIAGGHDGTNYLSSAEIFDPSAGTFAAAGTMSVTRQDHCAALLADGRVLIAGGYNGSALATAEIYDPSTQSFVAASGSMAANRRRATATLLPDKNVLVAGGTDGTNALETADLFDPASQTFKATTNNMGGARSGHTAVFLEAGTDGYLRVTSKPGLVFTEYYSGSVWGAMMNGLEISKFNGVRTLYALLPKMFPQSKAILNLINTNDSVADLKLWLHRKDGSAIEPPVQTSLFPGAQLKADLTALFGDAADLDSTPWLQIETSIDRVVGTLTLANAEERVLTSYELSGTPLDDFVFPMAAADGNFKTAVALLNSCEENAIVTIDLWGPGGTLDRSTTLTIQPGKSMISFLEGLYPGLGQRLVSNVRIRSDRPLHAICLLTDVNLNFLAPVPPIPHP